MFQRLPAYPTCPLSLEKNLLQTPKLRRNAITLAGFKKYRNTFWKGEVKRDSFSPSCNIILYHSQSFLIQLTSPPHLVCILFVCVVCLWVSFYPAVEINWFLHTDNFMFCFGDVCKDFKRRLVPNVHSAVLVFSKLSHSLLVA